MMYQGGKELISKKLAAYLETRRTPGQLYLEPFVGGAAVVSKMTGPRVAADANGDVIAFWQAIQQGLVPPETITREQYHTIKDNPDAHSARLRGFVGAFCSFGGKWWGGYAHNNSGRDYVGESVRAALKRKPDIDGVLFLAQGYDTFSPNGALIYCDPPYANTTGYKGTGKFDSVLFWDTMRVWAKTNTVFVSEYVAPPFAKEVWRVEKNMSMRKTGAGETRTEKLFEVQA